MGQAVPVDIRIRAKGIQLASRRLCCEVGDVEILGHLFLHSDVRQATWKCFGTIFRLPYFF